MREQIAKALGLQKDNHGWYKLIRTPSSGQKRIYFDTELDAVMQIIEGETKSDGGGAT